MTPEKALDILEGRVPHREFPKAGLEESRAPHGKKPLINDREMANGLVPAVKKVYTFPQILSAVVVVAALAVAYLWSIDTVYEHSYKNGFNAGIRSVSGTLASEQKNLDTSGQQITQLQQQIAADKQDLGSLTQRNEQLTKSLKETQASIPDKIGAVRQDWEGKIKTILENFQKKVNTLNDQLALAQRNLAGKQEQAMGLQQSMAQSRQERDTALSRLADKEMQLAATQKDLMEKDRHLRQLQQEVTRFQNANALLQLPVPGKIAVAHPALPLSKPLNGSDRHSNAIGLVTQDQTVADYSKALETNPNDINARLKRGSVYEQNGDVDQAIVDFNKAIEIAPGLAQAYTARGTAFEAKGNYDKAIMDFDKALKINPGLALCFFKLGEIYYLKGRHGQADSYWNRALRLSSLDSTTGITYYRAGDHDQVIWQNSEVIKAYPDYVTPYYVRGAAYAAKGNHDKAIGDFTKAIQLNPQYREAYSNRAVAFFLTHEYGKALEDVQMVQKLRGAVNGDFFNSLKIASGN